MSLLGRLIRTLRKAIEEAQAHAREQARGSRTADAREAGAKRPPPAPPGRRRGRREPGTEADAGPAAPPSPAPRAATAPLADRVRARLRGHDALREAFVLKEILDRPVARRRR